MTVEFREKIQSMTSSEIIMSMVNGLKEPVLPVNMLFFTIFENGRCYGCAATNAICKIIDIKENEIIDAYHLYQKEKNLDGYIGSLSRLCDDSDERWFLDSFENAIDMLRLGSIRQYNEIARANEFAIIDFVDHYLPRLHNNFTQEELDCYIELAKDQNKLV